MFGMRFTVCRLFGIPIRVDLSWFFVVLLIAWSLALGFFPQVASGLDRGVYWAMGFAGAIGLFASILFHELAHALVARRYGIPMQGITLFVFGGVAEMSSEPPSAKSEFWVAIAGPIATLVLVGAFYLSLAATWPITVAAVISWLMTVNAIVLVFNLVPAFPLDGGRVLRSALWAWRGNLRWATRVTAGIGAGFGLALMILAVFPLIAGNFISAMWSFLLGLFLRNAAQMSYQQVVLREALRGEPISRFMKTDVVTVPLDLPLDHFVQDYIYQHRFKMYPAVDDGRVVGCVTIDNIRNVPQDDWPARTVSDVMQPCTPQNTISPDADAVDAMQQMSQQDQSRLLVVRDDQLVGVVALRDLLRFLSLKLELEGDGATAQQVGWWGKRAA